MAYIYENRAHGTIIAVTAHSEQDAHDIALVYWYGISPHDIALASVEDSMERVGTVIPC